MKFTIVCFYKTGQKSLYRTRITGVHLGKDYAQAHLLKNGIGCARVVRVTHGTLA